MTFCGIANLRRCASSTSEQKSTQEENPAIGEQRSTLGLRRFACAKLTSDESEKESDISLQTAGRIGLPPFGACSFRIEIGFGEKTSTQETLGCGGLRHAQRITTERSETVSQKGEKSVLKEGRVSSTQLRQLLEDQNYRCALTGMELTPRLSSLDHKNPIEAGGANDISNLQIVHPLANFAKARMTQSQFVNMCHLIAKSHENTGDESWYAMTPRGGPESGS
jgi:5-methylcytosine-specific restriction endonuclease McrA